MARPRIDIDTETFRKLCSIQCTLSEIASWFKCSEDTVERYCKRELNMSFADAYKMFSADGRISLRRMQFKSAEKGNTSMLIWLGKQYLGQRDATAIDISTEDDDSVKAMEEYFDRKKSEGMKTQ